MPTLPSNLLQCYLERNSVGKLLGLQNNGRDFDIDDDIETNPDFPLDNGSRTASINKFRDQLQEDSNNMKYNPDFGVAPAPAPPAPAPAPSAPPPPPAPPAPPASDHQRETLLRMLREQQKREQIILAMKEKESILSQERANTCESWDLLSSSRGPYVGNNFNWHSNGNDNNHVQRCVPLWYDQQENQEDSSQKYGNIGALMKPSADTPSTNGISVWNEALSNPISDQPIERGPSPAKKPRLSFDQSISGFEIESRNSVESNIFDKYHPRHTVTSNQETQRSNSQHDMWYVRFQELRQFKANNGHCNVPFCYPENNALGHWVGNQRRSYNSYKIGKKSSLTPERVKALGDLGFIWDVRTAKWDARVDELRRFKEKNGHCRVPVHSSNSEDRQLGHWVASLRSQYRQGKLPKKKIDSLTKLGFVWVARTSSRKEKQDINVPENINHSENGYLHLLEQEPRLV